MRKKLLFVQAATEPLGGKEAVFAWALQAACARHEVTVFTWSAAVNVAGFNRQYGTSLKAQDFGVRRPGVLWRLLCRLLAAFDPDPATIQPAMLLMRLAKRQPQTFDLAIACEMEADLGLPGVQYIHYPWLEQFAPALEAYDELRGWGKVKALFSGQIRPWMWIGDFSLRRMRANRTATNSVWTGRRIRAAYGIESTPVYPPAAGVVRQVPWEERENGFLCIGRIHRDKRLEWLLEALEPLRAEVEDLHLHIVGKVESPKYFGQIQELVEDHASWVTLHPNLSRGELQDLAVQQRYGVHAMVDEHFGIAIAEMLGAGCIPFVHDSGGAVEIVQQDPRVVYRCAEELRARILRIVRNPLEQSALREDLGRSAERFSPEKFMSDFLRVVDSACHR